MSWSTLVYKKGVCVMGQLGRGGGPKNQMFIGASLVCLGSSSSMSGALSSHLSAFTPAVPSIWRAPPSDSPQLTPLTHGTTERPPLTSHLKACCVILYSLIPSLFLTVLHITCHISMCLKFFVCVFH